MTLRRLQNTHILPMVAEDPRLRGNDCRIHSYVYHKPMQSLAQIREALGISKGVALSAVTRLIETGWAEAFVLPGRVRGRLILPAMPTKAEQHLSTLLIRRRTSVPFLGEWLMRNKLDYNVYDYDWDDDASPDWMITAVDKVSLQLDRWYEAAKIALEFQGSQHFKVSNRFVRTVQELARRRRYDGEKIRLCHLHKIELIEVMPADLEPNRLRALVNRKLPLLPPRPHGPVYRELMGMYNQLMKYVGSST